MEVRAQGKAHAARESVILGEHSVEGLRAEARAGREGEPLGTDRTLPQDRSARWDGWLCALVSLLCFLAAQPYVEMGMSDDFSYAKTAWLFAQTGKLVYNGWATAMLGWQIPWAAPFIHLLGYNYFALRVSVTVLMVLTVVVTHATMRLAGLNRVHAAFGALVVGLCPLTMAMTATFMTDIGGMLVVVGATYCALRVLRARTDSSLLGWLVLGFLIGAVGGTSRQIAWMCALVMMPSAAWLVRRRRSVVPVTVLMWILSAGIMFWSLWWFKRQPFNVPEPLKQGPLNLRSIRPLFDQMLMCVMCLVLLVTPVLAEGLPAAWRKGARVFAGLVALGVLAAVLVHLPLHHAMLLGWMPWQGDILARMDMWTVQNMWSYGTWPSTLSTRDRIVISMAVTTLGVMFAYAVWKAPRAQGRGEGADGLGKTGGLSWRELTVVLLPFTLAYFGLMAPRGIWSILLDRYLLPLMILGALVLLRLGQERLSPRISAASWTVLVIFALWGVAGLHDWIAGFRARVQAVQRLHEGGVQDVNIRGGFEMDGLTQINLTGAVVDPRVKFPAGFDTHKHRPPGTRPECEHLFHEYTPTLEPHYVLAYDQEPCLVPSPFGEVDYRAWLPPFHRRQVIFAFDPTRTTPGS